MPIHKAQTQSYVQLLWVEGCKDNCAVSQTKLQTSLAVASAVCPHHSALGLLMHTALHITYTLIPPIYLDTTF